MYSHALFFDIWLKILKILILLEYSCSMRGWRMGCKNCKLSWSDTKFWVEVDVKQINWLMQTNKIEGRLPINWQFLMVEICKILLPFYSFTSLLDLLPLSLSLSLLFSYLPLTKTLQFKFPGQWFFIPSEGKMIFLTFPNSKWNIVFH